MATKVHQEDSVYSREAKLLRSLISHERMISLTSDRETPRQAYAAVEGLLDWNYHYYLQRGSYEVEAGDLNLAKNFLEQARALAPEDHMVQNEWAYMSLKRAAQNAAAIDAKERAEEAMQDLEDSIENRGRIDSYPYHILGSQGLSWVRKAILSTDEKARLLARLLKTVEQGVAYHPRHNDLKQLAEDIKENIS
jgi:tetratricopeptide (TPR) repeat protein